MRLNDAIAPFQIDWNACTKAQWDAMLAACKRPTLPQSQSYAMALAKTTGMRADFGVIRFHDRPVGLLQVQIRPLLGALALCRIYRGPVWIHDEIPGEMLKLVLRLIRRRYRLRRGKILVFHPELVDTPKHRSQMRSTGFVRRQEGYASIWLDLSPPEKTLRRQLKSRWRNMLNQAERNDLQINTDDTQLEWLLDRYVDDRRDRGYAGPSAALIRTLHELGGADSAIRILVAHQADEPIAGVLLTVHGRAATYLVGYTSEAGRDLRAHHLLLWEAASRLKQEGMLWLDLGGVNEAGAAGVARFKAGLGGAPFTLVGGYA